MAIFNDTVTFWASMFAIAAFLTALAIASFLVKDTAFIKAHPIKFTAEIIVFSTIPAIALSFLAYSRTRKVRIVLRDFFILTVKFAIFHVLLQLSGFYTYMYKAHAVE